MKNVLIVDDETSFIISLTDGLSEYSHDFNVITARNGQKAVEAIQASKIDLVVTDLKMPVMDGFELLAFVSNYHPTLPVIVMTAFGTPEIEDRTHQLGAIQYIEKPLDFRELAEKIYEGLAAGSKGYINGISLPSFLQLLEMDKKTCTLKIRTEDREGTLYLLKGVLLNAETATSQGEAAAYEIVCWDNATIEIASICKKRNKVIAQTLSHLLMEGFRRKDEQHRNIEGRRAEQEADAGTEKKDSFIDEASRINPYKKEINIMAVQDKLKELATIDGFGGVGLFTPTGEVLAMLDAQGSKTTLKEVGVLANNVLMNAQKASLDMGTGRGQLVHVEAEHAHFIVRCLNEGTDPLRSQPGKAHIHLVLVLTSDASIGLAKMKVASVIQQLAEEFRM